MSKDRVKERGKWVFLQLMTTFGWQHAIVKSTKIIPPPCIYQKNVNEKSIYLEGLV